MKNFYKIIITFLLVSLPLIIYFINPKPLFDSSEYDFTESYHYSPGKVVKISDEIEPLYEYSKYPLIQIVKVKLQSGQYKNQVIHAENYIWDLDEYNFDVNVNDIFLIKYAVENEEILYPKIEDYYRKNRLYILIIILIIILITFNKKIGTKLLLTLFITFITLFFIVIPYFIAGYSLIYVTIISGLYIITTSFILIMGYSLKTLNSIFTTILSIIIVTLLGIYFIRLLNITGFTIFEIIRINNLTEISENNIFLLWVASICFSMIGAIMDVSGGMSSALQEITENINEKNKYKKIFISGCNVGRDVISTELSTIFFAYTGIILVQFIIYKILNTPFLLYINWEFINIFLLFPILSSLGIIITIPLAIVLWLGVSRLKRNEV